MDRWIVKTNKDSSSSSTDPGFHGDDFAHGVSESTVDISLGPVTLDVQMAIALGWSMKTIRRVANDVLRASLHASRGTRGAATRRKRQARRDHADRTSDQP